MCRKRFCSYCFVFSLFFLNQAQATGGEVWRQEVEVSPQQAKEYAGEFFGVPVPIQNYLFVRGVVSVFGIPPGSQKPQDEKEFEDQVWEQLILSYEAFRRGVQIKDETLADEVSRILKEEKADFDWRLDKEKFAAWLKEKLGASPELFQNQVRHLLQIQKLKEEVFESVKPQVSDAQALAEYTKERSSLSVELAQFDTRREAAAFFREARFSDEKWQEQKKKSPERFRRPGFVSTEFLIDLWKIPRLACERMMRYNTNGVYPPVPVYKGYGVCKVLEKKPADRKGFENVKESLRAQVERHQKFGALAAWLAQLKKQAGVRTYKTGGGR